MKVEGMQNILDVIELNKTFKGKAGDVEAVKGVSFAAANLSAFFPETMPT